MNPGADHATSMPWSELVNVAGGLVLVIVLIFALSWLARKSGRLNALASDRLRIVCNRSIGGRERLLVIELDGHEILLGVTPNSITRLHELGPSGQGFADALVEAGHDASPV